MFTPEGIAFSVLVNTLVPDAYEALKGALGLGFDRKLNQTYHRAVNAVLHAANHRQISGMSGPASEGSDNYKTLIRFLWQQEFVLSVTRTISYGNPLHSAQLHSAYPSTLSQAIS